jgi:plasmid stabilization system protein ParE
MTEYQIEVSEPAEAEIDTAYYYLLLRSPQAATRLRQGLAKAIRSLTQMPSRCPLAPENGRLDRPIRQLLYRHGSTTYRILFIVIEATEEDIGIVRITRVLHGAQQHLGSAADQPDED